MKVSMHDDGCHGKTIVSQRVTAKGLYLLLYFNSP